MKTLLIISAFITLSLGASAQRKGFYPSYRPHVIVAPSIGFGYGYYPYFGSPFYNPYGYNPYYERSMPYKLSSQIQSIKVDYKNRIKETRRDKSIKHSQKKQEIRNLKGERAQDIANAERDFWNNRRNNYNNNRQ